MSLRLPKPARLGRAGEFARVKRDGTGYPGRYFVLSVLRQASGEEPARIGIITSKRVGESVVRHRVRRRLRELFRLARPTLRRGLWIVLIARAPAARADFPALAAEWQTLARRSGILAPAGAEAPAPESKPGA